MYSLPTKIPFYMKKNKTRTHSTYSKISLLYGKNKTSRSSTIKKLLLLSGENKTNAHSTIKKPLLSGKNKKNQFKNTYAAAKVRYFTYLSSIVNYLFAIVICKNLSFYCRECILLLFLLLFCMN